MANTADTAIAGSFVQVTFSGSGADWSHLWTNSPYPRGMLVHSIEFRPSGDGDILVINEGGNDGASIMHVECNADDDSKIKYFGPKGTWMKPYIQITDCNFGDITAIKVIFDIG